MSIRLPRHVQSLVHRLETVGLNISDGRSLRRAFVVEEAA